jgi:hypothetical protein
VKSDRQFTFKAKRDYLHSTSLFDDLVAHRGDLARQIDFRFSHKTDRQVSYLDTRPSPQDVLVAEWSDAGGQLYVVERNEAIREAVPYDEAALVSRFRINGRTVEIPAELGPFTRIDALVAAFKHLLQQVSPLEGGRKHAFVRIRLARVPQGATSITYARDIGTFSQGDIREDGKLLGQIFFGVWT